MNANRRVDLPGLAFYPQITQIVLKCCLHNPNTGRGCLPPWRTKTEFEEGDEMGMSTQSAEQLGLVVQFEIDQRNPNFEHEEVISIKPPEGSVVMPGTTVVVRINLEG